MQIGRGMLPKLILSGCFGSSCTPDSAWVIQKNSLVPQPEPMYTSNANGADSRIWRHVEQTPKSKVIVYSPDTNHDVHSIGLMHLSIIDGQGHHNSSQPSQQR